ncbi:YueI family protein [Microbacteriaceae bacterium 4G12]
MNKKVEDYLQEGIYGAKEINPQEKKMFLSTFRERVELALTSGQVMQDHSYQEVITSLQKSSVKMYVNGNVPYTYLSKYIALANKFNVPFTIVQNKEAQTPIGLVVAHAKAIDKENIFVKDTIFNENMK